MVSNVISNLVGKQAGSDAGADSGVDLDIVLLHGWGLNSGIWQAYVERLAAELPLSRVHCLDLPGYGVASAQPSSDDLTVLAQSCLDRAPDKALWVGWSLGGMVAMQAALQDQRQQISALQLIGTSARFVVGDDWPQGVDTAIFQRFADELKADYRKALEMFLLLQSGVNRGARDVAKKAMQAIAQYNDPTPNTLQLGIDCLAVSDLRQALSNKCGLHELPTQVVVGALDRVANAAGGHLLAQQLGASMVEIHAGHAPFLTHPDDVLNALKLLIAQMQNSEPCSGLSNDLSADLERHER